MPPTSAELHPFAPEEDLTVRVACIALCIYIRVCVEMWYRNIYVGNNLRNIRDSMLCSCVGLGRQLPASPGTTSFDSQMETES